MFGSNSLFGSVTSTTASATTTLPLFGTTGTAAKPLFGTLTTTATATPIFGQAINPVTVPSTTPTTITTAIPQFVSTTVAAPIKEINMPNQTSLFGQTTNSLFGSVTSTTASATTTTTMPLFGFGNTTATASKPLFGFTTTTAAPIFGQTANVTTAVPSTTITMPQFGNTTVAAPIFGQAQGATSLALKSLFSPATSTITSATASTMPLFGTTSTTAAGAANPLFGTLTTTATTTPIFGQTTNVVTVPSTTPTTTTTTIPQFVNTAVAAPIKEINMPNQTSQFGPTTTAGMLSAPITAPAVKKMTFNDLEKTLMKIRIDFEQQEKQFLDEVDDLNTFDLLLRRSQDKIMDLGQDVNDLEQEKDRYIWELDILAEQQSELEQTVQAMEKQLGIQPKIGPTGMGSLQQKDSTNATPADVQRQNILQLQMDVNAQLRQLDDEVDELCEQISDLQRVGGLPSTMTNSLEGQERLEELEQRRTMVDQIRHILRSQLETLVWVDKQSESLLERVQRTNTDILSLQ